MRFQNPQFLTTVVEKEKIPRLRMPEIAVVGRSNVGKSSLLNHLFGEKIVKTSSTPGKTRSLNFFTIDNRLLFVDLPGYGYAKAFRQEKIKWENLIDSYLNDRENLALLLFLLDIRRVPSEEDLQMLAWMRAKSMRAVIVLTKCDKLSLSQRQKQTQEILRGIKGIPYVHYSTIKNEGRPQLISLIQQNLSIT